MNSLNLPKIFSSLILFLMFRGIQNVYAETLLTGKMQAESEGSLNNTKWSIIGEYHRDDQCFAKPETDSIFSFAFVFQLAEDAINSGTGLTICYFGQLDKQNKRFGKTPRLNYRVPNVKRGNTVVNICEKAREQLKANCSKLHGEKKIQCMEFTSAQWHGINLVSDGPDKLNIILSTTDETFVIERKHFKDDRLVLKLTRWNGVVATFSRITGPGYHRSKSPEYDRRQELANLVRIEKDTKLRKAFKVDKKKGAPLRNYVGVWTLGVDILPSIEGEMALDFFVIRSNCSEMDVTFLMPWDSESKLLPHPAPKMKWPMPHTGNTKLIINRTVTFRGRIHDAAQDFFIALENPEGFYGIRMKVTFENDGTGKVVFEKKTQDGNWKEIDQKEYRRPGQKEPIEFHRGHHFVLDVDPQMENFRMRYNCGPWYIYSRGGSIDYVNWLNITIRGGVDIYDSYGGHGGPPGYHVAFELPLTLGEGFLQRANFSIWNEYKITFKSTDNNGVHNDIFVIDATKKDERIHYSYKDEQTGQWKLGEKHISFKKEHFQNGSDLHIKTWKDEFEITLDDNKLFAINRTNITVQLIKVDIDGAVDIIRQNRTFLAPRVFKLKDTDRLPFLPAYTLKGKVPKNADNFTIDLFALPNLKAETKVDDHLSANSMALSPVHIFVNFVNNSIEMNSMTNKKESALGDDSSIEWQGSEYFPMIFTRGNDVDIRIEVTDNSHKRYKLIVGSKNMDYFISYELKVKPDLPNAIQINGDIFLYEEPKVEAYLIS